MPARGHYRNHLRLCRYGRRRRHRRCCLLLWSETWLTLLVFVCAGFAALFLYPLTLRAAKSAKELEKAPRSLQERMAQARGAKFSWGSLETFKCADELARAFMMRRRVITEFIFAIQIGITFILALVIYYMASEALAGRERGCFSSPTLPPYA